MPKQDPGLRAVPDFLLHEVLPRFLDFVGGAPLAAHNAKFDIEFLSSACEDFGLDMGDPLVFDTLHYCRGLFKGEIENFRLGTVTEHIGYHNENAHRATDDALAVAAIIEYAANRT